MQLSEVQQAMLPGAKAMLEKILNGSGPTFIGYKEGGDEFAFTLVYATVERFGGNQQRAAVALGITPSSVSLILSGKSRKGLGRSVGNSSGKKADGQ